MIKVTNSIMAPTARPKPSRYFTPRRGRPSADQVAAIEATILTVAQKLFLTNGYAATTMEAVASESGVSKGTLYARYPDKPALFSAIVNDRLEAWQRAKPSDAPNEAPSLRAILRDFADGFLASVREPEVSAFHHLLAAEAERFPELAKAFYERGYQGSVHRLAEAIRSGTAGSTHPVPDPEGVALAFASALLGWLNATRITGEITDAECAEFSRKLVDIFMGGAAAA